MKKSLNFKLLMWAATSIFLVASALTFYSSNKIYDELLTKTALQSQRKADEIGREIELKITKAFEVTRSFARSLSQVKDKTHPTKLSRQEVIKMMEIQFKENETIFGLNTCWEPNAFDGKDNEYRGIGFHDKTGRLIPYMTRKADGSIKVEALVDYDKTGAGDYYLIPFKTGKDAIIRPYIYPVDGKDVLMITLGSPIVVDGVSYGATGADIDLTFFQNLADQKNELPNRTRIIIYDDQGTIVGFTGNPKALLKNIFKDKFDSYVNYNDSRFNDPKNYEVLDEKNLSILTSLSLENQKWHIEVLIPKNEILQPIFKEIGVLASIGFVLASLAMAIGFYLVNQITKNIVEISDQLKNSADLTRDGSESVKEAATKVSEATQSQAAAIQETAATLDQITSMVHRSVENAKKSSQQAANSFSIAEEGQSVVQSMRNAMSEIRDSNDRIMKQIDQSNLEIAGIVEVIKNISEKTKVINDIVFQTKLLSFNASVEAARAGEQGKGFAVVAEEVGSLANLSGNSSKEINDLIQDSLIRVERIVKNTQESVGSLINEGLNRVDQGAQVADRCGEILEQIVENVSSVRSLMEEVTSAAEEQFKGVKNISEAMNLLDSSTQQNTATVQETAEQSQKLYQESDVLNGIIVHLEHEVFGDSKRKVA